MYERLQDVDLTINLKSGRYYECEWRAVATPRTGQGVPRNTLT